MDDTTLKASLVNFYRERNPAKVAEVDTILAKFSKVGNAHLVSELEKKYGVRLIDYAPKQPPPSGDIPSSPTSGLEAITSIPTTSTASTDCKDGGGGDGAARDSKRASPGSDTSSEEVIANLRSQLKEKGVQRAREAADTMAHLARQKRDVEEQKREFTLELRAAAEREASVARRAEAHEKRAHALEKRLSEQAQQLGASEEECGGLQVQVIASLEAKERLQGQLDLLLASLGSDFDPYLTREQAIAGVEQRASSDLGESGVGSVGGVGEAGEVGAGAGGGVHKRGGAGARAGEAAEIAVLLRAKTELELKARDHVQHIGHLTKSLRGLEARLGEASRSAHALQADLSACQGQVKVGQGDAARLARVAADAGHAQAAAEEEAARLRGALSASEAARREVTEWGLRERAAVAEAAAEAIRENYDRVAGMAREDQLSQDREVADLLHRASAVEAQVTQIELAELSALLLELRREQGQREKEVAGLKEELARAARALVAYAPRQVVQSLLNGEAALL